MNKLASAWLILSLLFVVDLAPEIAFASRRAFVVAIEHYPNLTQLKSPAYDAEKVSEALSALGYQVTTVPEEKTSRAKLYNAWHAFLDSLAAGDQVVVYYSGHGIEVNGTNYIVPLDAPIPDDISSVGTLPDVLISLREMMDELSDKPTAGNIWILDACRDNPFAEGRLKSLMRRQGMGYTDAQSGTFILFAAGKNETAEDFLATDDLAVPTNSLYTREFLKLLQQISHVPLHIFAFRLKYLVGHLALHDKPSHKQWPASYDGTTEPWCFSGCNTDLIKISFQNATGTRTLDAKALQEAASTPDIGQPKGFPNTELTVEDKSGVPRACCDTVNRIKETADSIAAETESNAVFLGRKSLIASCKPSSDLYPFGCNVLRAAATGRARSFINVPLSPRMAVKVRKNAPGIWGSSYACEVRTLLPSAKIELSAIGAYSYDHDVYYWGTLRGAARDCAGAP